MTGGTGNQKKQQDHSDHRIVNIIKNTQQSPGKLRRLAVTDSSERPPVLGGVKNSYHYYHSKPIKQSHKEFTFFFFF